MHGESRQGADGYVLSMGTKIWDPEPQNRVQNRPQNRVQNGKIDIQSWVLIRPFSARVGSRNGREMAIRPTKKADFFGHFEARELSYPIIAFLGHFLNLQNL